MILRYHPEGTETPTEWQFDLGKLRTREIEAIEKRTRMQYGSVFKQELLQGSALARRALLWTFLRRDHHTLLFDDVDFGDAEVVIEMETHELVDAIEELRKNDVIPEDQRIMALAALQADLDSRRAADPDAVADPDPDEGAPADGDDGPRAAVAEGKARTRSTRSQS